MRRSRFKGATASRTQPNAVTVLRLPPWCGNKCGEQRVQRNYTPSNQDFCRTFDSPQLHPGRPFGHDALHLRPASPTQEPLAPPGSGFVSEVWLSVGIRRAGGSCVVAVQPHQRIPQQGPQVYRILVEVVETKVVQHLVDRAPMCPSSWSWRNRSALISSGNVVQKSAGIDEVTPTTETRTNA